MMQSSKPKHLISSSIFQSALCFFVFVLNAIAQSLPPARSDGFVYTNHRVDSDTVIIEAFFDPVCPDSRDSWHPLKQALQFYGHHTWLVVHLLPLPYHDNAFVTSRALHIVNNLNTSATFDLLESFFHHQEKFYNDQTSNLSRAAIVNETVTFVASAIGNSSANAIESGFSDRATDLKTRVSFKYASSRGVYATPFFFVNGFVLPDAGSAIDYKGWRSIVDPLIKAQQAESHRLLHLLL